MISTISAKLKKCQTSDELDRCSHSPKVLYVEDDDVQAAILMALLSKKGFTVIRTADGFSALNCLQQDNIDIVLTDHYMPKMTGIELIQSIKKHNHDIPIVLMTAADELSLAFSALRAGADDFVSKDAKGDYLAIIDTMLHRTLDKHRLQLRTKKLESDLAHERELSHRALDAVTQGIITLDSDLTVRYGNAFFCTLLSLEDSKLADGFTMEELSELLQQEGAVAQCTQASEIRDKFTELITNKVERLEFRINDLIFDLHANELNQLGYVISFTDVTSLKANQNALSGVLNQAPVAIIAINRNGDFFLGNEKACTLFGKDHEALLNSNINEFIPEQYRVHHDTLIQEYFRTSESRAMRGGLDVELINAMGRAVSVEIALCVVDWFGDKKVLATVVDISHRKHAEELLHRANRLTQSIIDHSPFSIVATDLSGTIIAVSPALENMLDYQREELIGKANVTRFHQRDELELFLAEVADQFSLTLYDPFKALTEKANRGIVDEREWRYVKRDGSSLPVNLTVTSMLSENEDVTGYLFVSYDITEQKRASEYVAHIAHHDALTGLPNRMLMHDRLNQALLLAKRNKTKAGVLAIDLDNFKRVNDSLGHLMGDELLKAVADRLGSAVRETDTVCRMGGDEFVVILPDVANDHAVNAVAKKILKELSAPIELGRNSIIITPSVGISLAPDDGTTSEELLKHADIAMYEVKHAGRNGFQLFTQELAAAKLENIALEQDLHQAFSANELTLHYQPQVDTYSGRVIGLEALIRWPHPEQGMIPPGVFIPMAENTGIILRLGEWILFKACSEIQGMREAHGADYRVAVNVSPRQFDDPNFIRVVDLALRRSRLPADRLELEITEGLLVTESSIVRSKLEALHNMGISLAIDDFGTGYSSLSYVSKYPISIIKIDRAFMALEKKENSAIVGAIIAIAEGLGIEVLAEGIETQAQLEFVQNKGCHLIQGYYYAKPLPLEALARGIQSAEDKTNINPLAIQQH